MTSPENARPDEVLVAVNRAWRDGRFDDLEPLLHDHAVIAGPNLTRYAEGREACLASYRDFVASSTVDAFDEHDVHAWEHDGTAVVTYTYRIRYTADGQYREETGRELVVLVAAGHRWQVVWRQLLPGPRRPPEDR